jgi:hypothetical protein
VLELFLAIMSTIAMDMFTLNMYWNMKQRITMMAKIRLQLRNSGNEIYYNYTSKSLIS